MWGGIEKLMHRLGKCEEEQVRGTYKERKKHYTEVPVVKQGENRRKEELEGEE